VKRKEKGTDKNIPSALSLIVLEHFRLFKRKDDNTFLHGYHQFTSKEKFVLSNNALKKREKSTFKKYIFIYNLY